MGNRLIVGIPGRLEKRFWSVCGSISKPIFDWAQIKCRFFVRQIVTGLQTNLMTHNRQIAVRNLLWEGEFYCANAEHFAVVRRKSRESRQKSRIPQKLKASFLWWLTNEVVSSSEVFWQASDSLSNGFFFNYFYFSGELKINLFQLRGARRERALRSAWQPAPSLVSSISSTGGGADIWICPLVLMALNAVPGGLKPLMHQHVCIKR